MDLKLSQTRQGLKYGHGVVRKLVWFYQELRVERLNKCGGEQMQAKRVTREMCGVKEYKEWSIEILMNWEG